jgi:hypothetical protein
VCWVLDDKSGAGTLILPLERKGIVRMPPETDDRDPRKGPQRGQLWIPTAPQYGAACGTFTDTVRQGGLVHLGQEDMTVAIDGAKSRPLGDGAVGLGPQDRLRRHLAAGRRDPRPGGLERWRHLAEKRIEIGADQHDHSELDRHVPAGRPAEAVRSPAWRSGSLCRGCRRAWSRTWSAWLGLVAMVLAVGGLTGQLVVVGAGRRPVAVGLSYVAQHAGAEAAAEASRPSPRVAVARSA